MLKAFYYSIIIKFEKERDITNLLLEMKEHSNKLGSLLVFRSGLIGEVFIRLFAYVATIENKLNKIEVLTTETTNEDTLEILNILMGFVEADVVVDTEIFSHINSALNYFQDKMYDDAYLSLTEIPLSIKKTQLLLGIATMTEDEAISQEAVNQYDLMSELEKEEIKSDPHSKGWLLYVLGTHKELDKSIIKNIPSDWIEWFEVLVQSDFETDIQLKALDEFAKEHKYFDWGFIEVQKVADLLFELAVEDALHMGRKQLIQLAVPMFTAFVLSDPEYPSAKGKALYESIILSIQIYGNKNKQNAGSLFKLIDGMFQLDVTATETQWVELELWLTFPPSMKMALDVLELLELFHDYGLNGNKLKTIWDHWIGNLIEQLSSEMRTEIQYWLQLGQLIGGDYQLVEDLKELIETSTLEDPFSKFGATTVTIFTCREKSAKRAAEKIMDRNPLIKVKICTDDKFTEQAKTYARNSDISIVVTSCISHALTYGISPYLKQDPLYPRSSGEAGIVEVLEGYAGNIYN